MAEAARKLDEWIGTRTRAAPRAAVYATVDLLSEHNFWTGLTMNLSEGGLFVSTFHAVPIGTRLMLNMLIPFERDPLVMVAEVRWTRGYSNQDDVPPGLGLQFVDADAGAIAKIRMFVSTVREPLLFEE